MRHLSPILAPCLTALAALALSACTATTSSADMLPSGMVIEHSIEGAVRIETQGTGEMGFGERVNAHNLATALRQGILDSGLFQAVADEGEAEWILSVAVAEVSDPEPDLFPVVEATLVWRLSNGDGSRVFWEQTIQTEAEATPQDNLDYVLRESIATGRAIAENLHKGIERMSRLELMP